VFIRGCILAPLYATAGRGGSAGCGILHGIIL